MRRVFWLIVGLLALSLGIAGILLPLLPTVPFLLLSAFSFAQSSARLHGWLMDHPRLGPPIRDWQSRGAIGRRAKWLATASMLAAFLISVGLALAPTLLLIQAAVLACVALFIWTRPEA